MSKVKTILKLAGSIAVLAVVFGVMINSSFATTDLRGVGFRMIGSFDINGIPVGGYSEKWVKFVKDGEEIFVSKEEAQITATLNGNGKIIGKRNTRSGIENLVNSQPAGLYKIKYQAEDLTGSRRADFTEHFRSIELVGGRDLYKWDIGNWGNCVSGIQKRSVVCRDRDNNSVSDSVCINAGLGSKPATSQTCNVPNPTTYHWYTGSWGSCSNGIQYRTVECRDNSDNYASSNKCSGSKPATSRTCGDPTEYHWYTGPWGTCNYGIQYRDVECRDDYNDLVSSSKCSGSKPATSRTCNDPYNDDITIDTISATNVDEDSATLRGRVSEGENVSVWFVISEYDSTPSCSSSSDRISVYGSFDDGDLFSRTVYGLDEDEIYYYRACGENGYGDEAEGYVEDFETDGNNNNDEGDIETRSATDVDEDSATLRGRVEQGDNVDVWFVLSRTDSTPSCTSGDKYNLSGSYDEGDSFSKSVSGLREDERYYFRACGEDDNGDDVSGSVEDFRTDGENNGDDGDIETRSATNVDEDSATLRGRVEQGDNVDVWFVLSRTDSTPSCTSGDKYNLSGSYDEGDSFSKSVSGLREDERYYFRACGEDDNGDDVSGSVEDFRTGGENNNGDAPEVTTYAPTNIQSTYAQLNGFYDANGENTTVYFEWGRTASLGSTTASQFKGDNSGTMTHGFTNLSPNTVYCYRAVATNSEGTDRGDTRCFSTTGGITPPVTTVDINTLPDPDLNGDQATLGGEVARGNNIRTWFALDDSSSVSCRDSGDRTSYVGNYDAVEKFYDTVDNLERGKMYYYRACGSTSGGTIISGELRDFIAGGEGYGYGYGLSFIRLNIENGQETLTRGDSVEYNVEWENISEDDLSDLTLHVKIPKEIIVTGSSAGRFNEEENTVTMNISDLREGERGSMQVYGNTSGGLDEGEAIVAEATISFDNPINDAKENAIDYDDDIYTVYNPFGAAVFTLGSITIWGWLLVILLLILIVLIARWLYLEGKNRENEKNRNATNGNEDRVEKVGTQPEPIFEQPVSNYIPYRPNR